MWIRAIKDDNFLSILSARFHQVMHGADVGIEPCTHVLNVEKHDIEIRYGKSAPVRLQVNAAAGEELSVRHTFPAPQAQHPKPAWRRWYDQVKGQFK